MKTKNHTFQTFQSVMIVAIAALVGYLGYYGTRGVGDRALGDILAAFLGTIYFVAIFFGSLYVYTHTYLIGLSLPRRVLLTCLIPFVWMSKDILVMTESHPWIESLYWYLNPMYIWLGCLILVQVGAGGMLARYILKRRGEAVKVFSIRSLAAILIGLGLFAGIYAWGQGENLYSLFLDGYRWLFGTGTEGAWR